MAYERRPQTVKQVLTQQQQDAERARVQKAPPPATTATAVVPAPKPASTAVAAPDNRASVDRYLDDVAPATLVGRQIKGTKEHVFTLTDTGEPVSEDTDFIVLADQTAVGLGRFNGEGERPDFRMGLLYDGFEPPPRETLGDLDSAAWELGLDGKPADPWRNFMYLVLQHADTGELFTYTTASVTGRRAVGNLLRHYNRLQKTHPDTYPVVRLKVGGFNHRDERVGWVATPMFAVVGRASKDSAAKPDTSPAADMSDEIPF